MIKKILKPILYRLTQKKNVILEKTGFTTNHFIRVYHYDLISDLRISNEQYLQMIYFEYIYQQVKPNSWGIWRKTNVFLESNYKL